MQTVDEYINQFESKQKQWIIEFVAYMREKHPEITETLSYKIPTYKFSNTYIAFSIAKNHFTFHTLDFDCIEMLKDQLPKATFGKGCAKIKYTDKEAKQILFQMFEYIIKRHKDNINKMKK